MGKLQVGCAVVGSIMTNGYYINEEGSNQVIFIDPGDHGDRIYEALKERGLEVKAILLTHGHYDHTTGVEALKARSGARVYAHEAEQKMLEDSEFNMSADNGRPVSVKADEFFRDGQEAELLGLKFQVLHTPGHTPGGCCYYFPQDGLAFVGDTIFQGSVGRTDFPGGSMGTLIRSIKEKLLVLPDDTVLYPGHGESTTIAMEKKYNPFL